MGARFSADAVHYVFSRRPPPASVPAGVHFVNESIGAFAERLRTQAGKNVWMMGIPLLAPKHREVALRLLGVQQFPDGVVQLHYEVQRSRA